MFNTALRLAWDDSVSQFRENLPWAMIALAIVVATCIVVFLIVYCGECCLRGARSTKYTKTHVKKSRVCSQSMGRIGILILAAFIGGAGFWIAATTFGISFWNIIFSYGIASLLVSTIFGMGLQNLGAYILVSFTGKIIMDRYIRFVQLPIEGRVMAINILWIEMEFILKGKPLYHYVPTILFISSPFTVDESVDAPIEYSISQRRQGLRI